MEATRDNPLGLSVEDAVVMTVEHYLSGEILYPDCAERLRRLSDQHRRASSTADRTADEA